MPFELSNALLKEMLSQVADVEGRSGAKNRDYYEFTKTLSEYDFDNPCPFKKGDWVTPKENSDVRNAGEPCLVLAAYEHTQYSFVGYGEPLQMCNMMLARMSFGADPEVKVYLVMSDRFEKYTGLVYGDGDAGESR